VTRRPEDGAPEEAPEEPAAPPGPTLEEVEELVSQARAEGRAEGRAELQREQTAELAQARKAVADQARELEAALAALPAAREAALTGATADVARVVEAFAHRVVERSLALHPEALPRLVRDCLALVAQSEGVHLRVPPDRVEGLRAALSPEWASHVEPDPSIEAGVRVVTRYSEIDATLAAADQAIRAAVEEWLAAEGVAPGAR
jgi:flagellar biosynthesis/type III secretory pathway protein FliH